MIRGVVLSGHHRGLQMGASIDVEQYRKDSGFGAMRCRGSAAPERAFREDHTNKQAYYGVLRSSEEVVFGLMTAHRVPVESWSPLATDIRSKINIIQSVTVAFSE